MGGVEQSVEPCVNSPALAGLWFHHSAFSAMDPPLYCMLPCKTHQNANGGWTVLLSYFWLLLFMKDSQETQHETSIKMIDFPAQKYYRIQNS